MADTLTLDRVVQYVTALGGSVRLIGDDQQLGAIGAGGILRDIKHTHGALQLTELHRFTHPAEAAASLALRDGDPAALDFYLNHGRVHVGDLATTTQDAFTAWAADRAAGVDAIMLAPTRELVADLNHRARTHRLGRHPSRPRSPAGRREPGQRRRCDHHPQQRPPAPHLGGSDWVKNGDRWTITHIGRHGDLTVRHTRSHLTARLPAHYVAESAELGYATTIHAAQGVTADTMHGLVTGQESRQQLYTMLTRGRTANHLYLQVVGDGDPHTVIRPETVIARAPPPRCSNRSWPATTPPPQPPPSSANSATPRSGSTRRSSATPTGCTSPPNSIVGPRIVEALDRRADQVVPGVTDEPAWPTLRTDLIALAAETGEHPLAHLHQAALGRDLSTAGDMAAVLDWRLPEPAPTHDRPPLPWLPGIPQAISDHPDWGDYLAQRSRLIADLADDVRHHALHDGTQPAWAPPGRPLSAALIGDIAVWRAANGINPHDHRPTGPEQLQTASIEWRQRLDQSIAQASADPAGLDGPEAASCSQNRPRSPARQSRPPAPSVRGPPWAAATEPRPVEEAANWQVSN